MEILLWLVPSVVVTAAAMAWVGWLGRDARGEIDREQAVRDLGRALARPDRTRLRPPPVRARERSTGVAVRAPRPAAPVTPPVVEEQPAQAPTRRAS